MSTLEASTNLGNGRLGAPASGLCGASVNVSPRADLLEKIKGWPVADLERFAAKLLVLNKDAFHGSLTVHFAAGIPKKIVTNETKDIS